MTDAPTWRVVLGHRGVRPMLVTYFVLMTANTLQATALGAQVYDISGSKLNLGLVGLAEFGPSALLILVTGAVADRRSRRVIVMIGCLGEFAACGGLFLYARSSPTAVGPIFAIVICFGVARAFVGPALRSLMPFLVPVEQMPRLVGMSSTTWQASFIVGPALGGVLYDVGPSVPYLTILVLLGIGIGAASRLPVLPRAKSTGGALLRSAIEGLSVVKANELLLGAIALDLFAVLFGGAVALVPAVVERLGVTEGHRGLAQGVLRAAGGVGALSTAVVMTVRPITRHVGKRLLVAVAVFGAATVVFGATRSYVVALLAVFVLSAADMVSVYVRATLVPLATPAHVRGRVTAVEQVFIGASNELGAFESGVAATAVGTAGAIVLGGSATLAIVGLWWWRFPRLRDVDRFEDVVATASRTG